MLDLMNVLYQDCVDGDLNEEETESHFRDIASGWNTAYNVVGVAWEGAIERFYRDHKEALWEALDDYCDAAGCDRMDVFRHEYRENHRIYRRFPLYVLIDYACQHAASEWLALNTENGY